MPPRHVRPDVKRNKTDATAAEAFCEAVTRPTTRFVPVKTVDQDNPLAPGCLERGLLIGT